MTTMSEGEPATVDLVALRDLIRLGTALTEDVRLVFEDNKISTTMVDPAHVCMAHLEIGAKNLHGDGETYAIDLSRLKAKTDELRWKKDSERKIKMSVPEEDKIHFEHPMLRWTNTTLDPELVGEGKIPHLGDWKATANINLWQFNIFLRIADKETDYIWFEVDPTEESIKAIYQDEYDERVETPLGYSLGGIEGVNLKVLTEEEKIVKSLFSVDYMRDTIKHIQRAEIAKIHLRDDYPIKMDFKMRYPHGHFKGYILMAPRIESE